MALAVKRQWYIIKRYISNELTKVYHRLCTIQSYFKMIKVFAMRIKKIVTDEIENSSAIEYVIQGGNALL